MGLDFTLYKKRKDMDIREVWKEYEHMNYNEFVEKYELAYGRKSWELVHILAYPDEIDKGYGILEKKSWDYLMDAMSVIGDKFEAISEAFSHEENAPVDYPEFIFTEDDKKLIAEYEYWYNKTFDEDPYTSYPFSVGYMKSFWDARDKVYEILDNPDSEYEVFMSISY